MNTLRQEKDFDLYRYYRQPEHKWHQFDGPYYPRRSDELVGLVNSYWKSKEIDWIDYLFKVYPHFVRLGFMIWSGNIGMIKVGQKLGMKEEA